MMIFEVRERFFFMEIRSTGIPLTFIHGEKVFLNFFFYFHFWQLRRTRKNFIFFSLLQGNWGKKKLFLLFLFVCHLNLRHFLRRKFVNFSYHHFYWCVTKQIYGEIREIYGKFSDIISMKNFTVYWLKIEIFANFLQPKSDKSDKIFLFRKTHKFPSTQESYCWG